MFRSGGIETPVLGIVENMAWFTPAELPDNRYYIFGEGGARLFAASEGIEFLGDIPIVQSIMESGEKGLPELGIRPEIAPFYVNIARRIVDKLAGRC
jgi:ATP-binding protein involved in chromosome partitioning